MDTSRFESFTRNLTRVTSRRRAIKTLAATAVGGTFVVTVATVLLNRQNAHAAQSGWDWCNQCNDLWFTGNGTNNICQGNLCYSDTCASQPGRNPGHTSKGSGNYILAFTPPGITTIQPGPVSGSSLQPNWKWCRNCQLLFFAGNNTLGACPWSPGTHHDPTGSGDYYLLQNVPGYQGHQQGWRWCYQCQSLWFSGSGNSLACPAGNGLHSMSGSGSYALPLYTVPSYGV